MGAAKEEDEDEEEEEELDQGRVDADGQDCKDVDREAGEDEDAAAVSCSAGGDILDLLLDLCGACCCSCRRCDILTAACTAHTAACNTQQQTLICTRLKAR
jgi:hypothetical protein